MTSDVMNQCADMVLADAICDYAEATGQPEEEVRTAIVSSPAYDALYDFETGLWQEGPDYFVDFFLRVERERDRKGVHAG